MDKERQSFSVLPYTHSVVRDLAWVMASPGLLQCAPQTLVSDDWCREVLIRHHDDLSALDNNPAPLQKALAQCRSQRLGIYFEQLMLYWLRDILRVEDLQHNLPVSREQTGSGKQTLGAFDFLFRFQPDGPLQHWEATVKFYLLKTMDNGEQRWVGPEGRDRLDLKLQRMFQHQLHLSQCPEAQAVTPALADKGVEAAAFIKGYLFYPLDGEGTREASTAVAVPACELSLDHLRGWWLHWGETALPGALADRRWMVLPKDRWLSSLCLSEASADVLDEAALGDHCHRHFCSSRVASPRPLLVVELARQSGAWREVSRGFVLPPQ